MRHTPRTLPNQRSRAWPAIRNEKSGNGYHHNAVHVLTPHTPRPKKPRFRVHSNDIRLYVNRRPKQRKPAAYNYECEHCEAWFSRSSERRRHMRTGCANGKQKKQQCPLCLKMYSHERHATQCTICHTRTRLHRPCIGWQTWKLVRMKAHMQDPTSIRLQPILTSSLSLPISLLSKRNMKVLRLCIIAGRVHCVFTASTFAVSQCIYQRVVIYG